MRLEHGYLNAYLMRRHYLDDSVTSDEPVLLASVHAKPIKDNPHLQNQFNQFAMNVLTALVKDVAGVEIETFITTAPADEQQPRLNRPTLSLPRKP